MDCQQGDGLIHHARQTSHSNRVHAKAETLGILFEPCSSLSPGAEAASALNRLSVGVTISRPSHASIFLSLLVVGPSCMEAEKDGCPSSPARIAWVASAAPWLNYDLLSGHATVAFFWGMVKRLPSNMACMIARREGPCPITMVTSLAVLTPDLHGGPLIC